MPQITIAGREITDYDAHLICDALVNLLTSDAIDVDQHRALLSLHKRVVYALCPSAPAPAPA